MVQIAFVDAVGELLFDSMNFMNEFSFYIFYKIFIKFLNIL